MGGVPVSDGSLLPWQARAVRGIAGKRVRTAAISTARSNGKTLLTGWLAARHLLQGPDGAECFVVASSLAQGKVGYRYLVEHLRSLGIDPGNRKLWRWRDTNTEALIRHLKSGRSVRVLGSDPKRMHGRKFGLAILDEPAQWPPGQRDAMLAAVETGADKVPGARIVAVGTRPETGTGHWFETWLGGGADYTQLHGAREGDPPFQVRTIRRANPSFDHLPVLREGLLSQRDKARKFPDVLASYRTYHLNAGTPDTGKHVLLSVTDWRRCECARLPERLGPVVWGVDPGGADAFSAIVAYWPRTGAVEGLQTVGGIPDLADRQRRDHAGRSYSAMVEEGSLVVQHVRRVPDMAVFVSRALGLFGLPAVVVTDRFRRPEVADALDGAGIRPGGTVLKTRRMRWSEAADDIRRARALILERKVKALPRVSWRKAIGESRVVVDDSGNERLAVAAEAGRRRRSRTDLASALVLALGEGDRAGPSLTRPPTRRVFIVG